MKQMRSNTLKLNFSYFKIIHILHPRYHPKIIEHILKTKEKCKSVFYSWDYTINHDESKDEKWNRSRWYDINRAATISIIFDGWYFYIKKKVDNWYFLMVEQIFLSQQGKPSVIISNYLVYMSFLTRCRTARKLGNMRNVTFMWWSMQIFRFTGCTLMESSRKPDNWRQIYNQTSLTFYTSNNVSKMC